MRSSFLALPLLLVAACTFDLPLPLTVQVSPDGDDANDGRSMPVKTLRHGIDIATANTSITAILVAAGRYNAASGETFPYSVPANVTLSGPADGGAILAGASVESGLLIGDGELRNLELEDFTVAVISSGNARLANLRVRSSETAVRGVAATRLTVTGLDITGAADACATGVELNTDATLTASEVSTRDLGTAFQLRDRTTASISKANITGGVFCGAPSFAVSTSRTFALDESIIDGGFYGVEFARAATPTTATLTGTIIRNMNYSGLYGNTVMLTMRGGEISGSVTIFGVEATGGTWNLQGVTIRHNLEGVHIKGNESALGMLTMRGCTVTNNSYGVQLIDFYIADLGTSASPGNNTFSGNTEYGLNVVRCQSAASSSPIVGNTWQPNVQGADAAGRYPVMGTVFGPVMASVGSNFVIATANCTLQR